MYKLVISLCTATLVGCATVLQTSTVSTPTLPVKYQQLPDSSQAVLPKWEQFYGDSNLVKLIDAGLKHNQELSIVEQEVLISSYEVQSRKGEYLPFLGVRSGVGAERISGNSWRGAVEDNLDVRTNEKALKSSSDLNLGVGVSWEIDVWKKLRNAKKAAMLRYLATMEGKNFLTTTLVAEIANSYYELVALDKQLETVHQNIAIQERALQGVRFQKEAAKLTQLAVNRFEAQLLNTRNYEFEIRQQIVETENRVRYLTGDHTLKIERSSFDQTNAELRSVLAGNPTQLFSNRPDIRQAEKQLQAATLDVQIARANFYPAFRLEKFLGFQAFSPKVLLAPESFIYNIAADLATPLVNRNNIKAIYKTANAQQTQALLKYGQSVLNAYLEVSNQLSRNDNLNKSYETKSKEVDILLASIGVSNDLFQSARADYIEVLLTQEEALKSRLELTEIRLEQWKSKVQLYRALGGGW